MGRFANGVIVIGCVLGLLSACGGSQPEPEPVAEDLLCPTIGVLEFAERRFQYRADANIGDPAALIWRASIVDFQHGCIYQTSEPLGVTVDIDMMLQVDLGPNGEPGTITVPFVVAVLDQLGATRGRQEFTTEISVDDLARAGRVLEELRQTITLANLVDGAGHQVVVGLKLDAAALTYNQGRDR